MTYFIAFIFFLIINTVVIFYIWILYKICSYVLKVFKRVTNANEQEYKKRIDKLQTIKRLIINNPVKTIIIFVFIANTALFIDISSKYYNQDMKYPKAKAYFFVGNVANVYSKILSVYMGAPDRWYLYPLHQPFIWIKQGMYSLGEEYIPSIDPELKLWKYDWFYHPYVIKLHEYRGLFAKRSSKYNRIRANKKFKDMLEYLWYMMDYMAYHKFEDKNRNYDFFLTLPTMGTYYFFEDSKLLPENEFKTKRIYTVTNPLITQRNKKLQKILEEVGKRWDNPTFIKQWLYKFPQAEANHNILILMIIEQRIKELIYKREFSCTHPLVKKYTKLRRKFFAEDNDTFKFLKKVGKEKLADRYIKMAKDNIVAEYVRQLLWEYCGIDVPGVSQKYWPEGGGKGFYYGLVTENGGYLNEVKILKNELNLTRINDSKPTITKEDIKKSRRVK